VPKEKSNRKNRKGGVKKNKYLKNKADRRKVSQQVGEGEKTKGTTKLGKKNLWGGGGGEGGGGGSPGGVPKIG